MAHLRLIHDNKLTAVASSATHPTTNDYKSQTSTNMDAAQLPVSAPQTATLVTKANPVLLPAASAAPANNGDLVFERTSDTSLTLRLKGTDGVVRAAALALA